MNTNSSSQSQPLWWQPALGHDGRASGAASVAQCVRTILSTPKGADPLRPEFGSDAWLYLDWPVPRAVPNVIRESVDAIRRWEPRCLNVRIQPVIAGEHVTLRVNWRLQSGGEGYTEVKWR
ncbi:baseplate protein [Salmonella enterica subsp. enterica]|nr:baseplate protein [Salmonella enterica subsp. enterica serovar Hvittingfoss]